MAKINFDDLPAVPAEDVTVSAATAYAQSKLEEVLGDRNLLNDILGGFGSVTDDETFREVVEAGMELESQVNEAMGKPFDAFAKSFGIDVDLLEWAYDLAHRVQEFTDHVGEYLKKEYDKAFRQAKGMSAESSFDMEKAIRMGMPPALATLMQSMANAKDGCTCETCQEKRAAGLVPGPGEQHSQEGNDPDPPSEDDIQRWLNEIPETDQSPE